MDAKAIIDQLKRQETEAVQFLPFDFNDPATELHGDTGLFNIKVCGQMFSIIRMENDETIVAWSKDLGDMELWELPHDTRIQIERAFSAWQTRERS